MMVAIPLFLLGLMLGLCLMGAFFSPTSFIGWTALAGIMVRNTVLFIYFIHFRTADADTLYVSVFVDVSVLIASILLTAVIVLIGAFVILFDTIFQGLAISLMGGTIVSTVLTLLVVPLVYYMIEKKKYK